MESQSTFRERAGVVVSGIVVMALILVGPVQMIAQIFSGATVTFDPTWVATVAGLAGTAFGFLIGKQTTNSPATAVNVPVGGDSTTTTVKTT